MAGLEGLTLIGFVGRVAAAEVLGRVLRRVRDGGRAAEGFVASGEGSFYRLAGEAQRIARSRGASLESVTGARVPGRPVLGWVDWSGGPGVRAGGAVVGDGQLAIATAGPRGLGASELARRLRDCWVPPLQLAVARTLAVLRSPVVLIVSTAYEPGRLVAASCGPPLWLAPADEGVLMSSDARVTRAFSRRIVLVKPGELAVADAEGFDLLSARTLARVPRIPTGPPPRADGASRAHAEPWRPMGRGAPAGEAA